MITQQQQAQLRAGVKVKLSGGAQPRKPYPRGWHEVAETNAEPSRFKPATIIRVVSDERWLPISLIEEVVL